MATQNDGMGSTTGMGAGTDDEVNRLAQSARHDAEQMSDRARDEFENVRQQAMSLKDQALNQARSAAADGKSKAAEALSSVAHSARDAASKLRENPNIAPVSKYGEQAADALERFAATLRDKEVDALLQDVTTAIRRNPAIAAGVAVAVGFALSRLLRSDTGRQA